MTVYVLSRYWDTPDNEGHDVLGVFANREDAVDFMRKDANATKAYYNGFGESYWDDDMTWESDTEIHMGRAAESSSLYATIYDWEITEHEVI